MRTVKSGVKLLPERLAAHPDLRLPDAVGKVATALTFPLGLTISQQYAIVGTAVQSKTQHQRRGGTRTRTRCKQLRRSVRGFRRLGKLEYWEVVIQMANPEISTHW